MLSPVAFASVTAGISPDINVFVPKPEELFLPVLTHEITFPATKYLYSGNIISTLEKLNIYERVKQMPLCGNNAESTYCVTEVCVIKQSL